MRRRAHRRLNGSRAPRLTRHFVTASPRHALFVTLSLLHESDEVILLHQLALLDHAEARRFDFPVRGHNRSYPACQASLTRPIAIATAACVGSTMGMPIASWRGLR